MIYEFVDERGVVVELAMPANDAPDIGAVIEHDGRLLKRIVSMPARPTNIWKPYVSSRLPRNLDGVEKTKDGKAVVRTQAQERNLAARLGMERE